MAIGRKTGGRQKGARNRATAEARAAAEATGILPLDYMLSVMRDAVTAQTNGGRRTGQARQAGFRSWAPWQHGIDTTPGRPGQKIFAGAAFVAEQPGCGHGGGCCRGPLIGHDGDGAFTSDGFGNGTAAPFLPYLSA